MQDKGGARGYQQVPLQHLIFSIPLGNALQAQSAQSRDSPESQLLTFLHDMRAGQFAIAGCRGERGTFGDPNDQGDVE